LENVFQSFWKQWEGEGEKEKEYGRRKKASVGRDVIKDEDMVWLAEPVYCTRQGEEEAESHPGVGWKEPLTQGPVG